MDEFGFGTKGIGGLIIVNDKNFVMQQLAPALVWSVPHNLGKRVSVQITDNSFNQIIGEVRWVNNNEVEITFTAPYVGWVYCN